MSAVSPAEYETRIRALEKLNATLAAEIDRMRPVVEAALIWGHNGAHRLPELARALIKYEASDEVNRGQIRTTTTKDTGE